MENRDRDKEGRTTNPTSPGKIDREKSDRSRDDNSNSDASFGQKIGESGNQTNEPRRSDNENVETGRGGSMGGGDIDH